MLELPGRRISTLLIALSAVALAVFPAIPAPSGASVPGPGSILATGESNPVARDVVSAIGLASAPLYTSTFGRPCVGDLTGDGIDDVLWSAHKSQPLNAYQGLPDGTFTRLTTRFGKNDNHGCVIADFDRDGRADVFGPQGACEGRCLKRDVLWLQIGPQEWRQRDDLMGPLTSDRSRVADVGDFNGDGWPDLVVVAAAAPKLDSDHRVLINLGVVGGRWRGFKERPLGDETPNGNATCLAVGDFDGDGTDDVLHCNDKPGSDRDGLRLSLNDGTGAFTLGDPGIPTAGARGVTVVDFDGDGDQDLAVAYVNRVAVYDSRGAPLLELPAVQAWDVLAPDIDGDGDRDLFVVQVNRAHQLWINEPQGWEQVAVPVTPRGAGDKAAVLPRPDGDLVLVGNGGQWVYRGQRQVIALD